jgi:DNA polymerase-1
MTILLLDADMLLHLALAIGQNDQEWEPDMVVRFCDIGECRNSYWAWVHELCELTDTTLDRVYHAFTGPSFFRRTLLPTYKSGRPLKPVGYNIFKAEILTEKNASMFKEIEADDAISIAARQHRREGRDYVVCSGDKDLLQIPGKFLWPWHPNPAKVMATVTEEQAERNFWMQALMGDSGDKIPGCPGVGPKTAEKVLAGLDPMDAAANWKAIVAAYRKANTPDPEADALLTARLARLLRCGDYDPATGTVNLWEPPT